MKAQTQSRAVRSATPNVTGKNIRNRRRAVFRPADVPEER